MNSARPTDRKRLKDGDSDMLHEYQHTSSLHEKVIGILGGMGPEATIDLFQKIVRLRKVRRDQEHFRIIIDNNPKIPDRTAAILGKEEDVLPALVATAKNLKAAGADFIIMPCVTAHYYYDELCSKVDIPFISIVDELIRELKLSFSQIRRIGLLSTSGTIAGRVFHKKLEGIGLEIIVPSEATQREQVMETIYGKHGIKAGYMGLKNKKKLVHAAEELIAKGAEGIIAGCTEVPIVLHQKDLSVPFFDTLLILARSAIRKVVENSE
jgi:aspartate racemase